MVPVQVMVQGLAQELGLDSVQVLGLERATVQGLEKVPGPVLVSERAQVPQQELEPEPVLQPVLVPELEQQFPLGRALGPQQEQAQ